MVSKSYFNSFLKNLKAQAITPSSSSGAALLVLLITVILIVYILFMSPADRELLLSGGVPGSSVSDSSGYGHLINTVPLQAKVGRLEYIRDTTIKRDLSSFMIYTSKDAKLISNVPSLQIKSSAFSKQFHELPFTIDRQNSENLMLSFNVERSSGTLLVHLNGYLLYEGDISQGSPQPISIPESYLKNENTLFFSVNTPGFAFWRVHGYKLNTIQIIGDITDESYNFNQQKIYVADKEFEHFERATLRFFPDCNPRSIGQLSILINGNRIFHGTPDCGLRNFIELGKNNFRAEENTIEFVSDYGSYILDQVQLDVELEDMNTPIYYFDLHEDLFVHVEESNSFCGNIDGVCPKGCSGFEDKDCCFADSRYNYWCDFKTDNPRDRCVNLALASNVDRCVSGYEDYRGNPPKAGEGICGDDTDGVCPAGCNRYYDKDCCFEIPDAYWCGDFPLTGRENICATYVTDADCQACASGYVNKKGQRPNCDSTSPVVEGESQLKAGVNVVLQVFFADQTYKKVDFNVNGNIIPIDTYSVAVNRILNPSVREGTNSIIIQPRSDLDIAQIKVVIE